MWCLSWEVQRQMALRPAGRSCHRQRLFRMKIAFASSLILAWGIGSLHAADSTVAFKWFEYRGNDAVFDAPLPSGTYRNPILPGFYPDPTVCRVGDDYYLVNSTFSYTPGLPIFHSRDLVHWRQIGNIIDRAREIKFDGLAVSRGLFAPTIRFHDGIFYVVNTAVDAGGNFFVTAKNPAGPWSEPHWLPEIDGIDPSFFFDDDGKAYLVNNGPPLGTPLYEGHRAIWIQEFNVTQQKLEGPRSVLVNGGTDISKKPVWIEGPHLLKRNGWYYLICAEGGTSQDHSEVVFRSKSPLGPFESFENNPILAQRNLPAHRTNPVTSTGHADFVETPDGSWWAVFLGCRPYQDDDYNTGRETFMLPVTWEHDWPIILKSGEPVPYVVPGPKLASSGTRGGTTPRGIGDPRGNFPVTGNFTYRDDFDLPLFSFDWMYLRDAKVDWIDFKSRPGYLVIHPLAAALSGREQPSYLARRQQHSHFSADAAMLAPASSDVSGGVVAFQNEMHYFYFGVRAVSSGYEIFLEQANNAAPQTVAHRKVAMHAGDTIQMKIEGAGPTYSFSYRVESTGWSTLVRNTDGTILSTASAGGFVGSTVGPFARSEATIQDLPSRF